MSFIIKPNLYFKIAKQNRIKNITLQKKRNHEAEDMITEELFELSELIRKRNQHIKQKRRRNGGKSKQIMNGGDGRRKKQW